MAYRFVLPRADVGRGLTPSSGSTLEFFEPGTAVVKQTYSDFDLTIPNVGTPTANSNGVFGDIFLDGQADVSLRNGDGGLIWGPARIYAPDDSVTNLAATAVSVADTAGNFTATNVETVFSEIADDYMRRNRDEVIEGDKTFNGAGIYLADNLLSRPEIRDFSVTHNVISSVAGVLTIDIAAGNSFIVTLTENITSMVIQNPSAAGKECSFVLRVIQDSAGGAYTLAQPASVVTPSAQSIVITTTNGARDKITYSTIDGGTVWEADFSQAYA